MDKKTPWAMRFKESWSITVSLTASWLKAVFLSGQYWSMSSSDLDARTESILSIFADDIKWGKQLQHWRAGPPFKETSTKWRK